MENEELRILRRQNMDFYSQVAVAAMQGIQEANSKLGIMSDLLPHELSKRAFDIADAMLVEYFSRVS